MKPVQHPIVDSPLYEPLTKLGLEDRAIARLLGRVPQQIVREWTDITLAAQERFGSGFFTRSPQAYLVDNVQKAAQGARTPPDWWHALRQAEREARRQAGSDELSTAAKQVFADVRSALFDGRGYGSGTDREGSRCRSSECPRDGGRPMATPGNRPIRIGQLLE